MEMSFFPLCCMLVSGKEGSNLVIHFMAFNVQCICCLLVFLVIVKCQREETVAVCGFPGIPAGAEIVERNGRMNVNTTFKENDVVEYRCRDGFRNLYTSRSTRTCHWNGTWLGETIQCQEQIYCNSGNLLQGNRDSVYQCHFNRTVRISFIELEFSGFSLEVYFPRGREREVICHHLSSPPAVRSQYKELRLCNNATTVQVEFRFQAETYLHFSIFASPTRKCDDYPSVPVNGIVATKTDMVIEYKCKSGYQLHGNTFRRCDSQSGLWLPSLPQCRPELKTPPIKQETSTTTATLVMASVQPTSSTTKNPHTTTTSRPELKTSPIKQETSIAAETSYNTSESEKGIAYNNCEHQDKSIEDMKKTKIAILTLTFVMSIFFIGLVTFFYYTEERNKKNLHRARPFDEPFYENTVHSSSTRRIPRSNK